MLPSCYRTVMLPSCYRHATVTHRHATATVMPPSCHRHATVMQIWILACAWWYVNGAMNKACEYYQVDAAGM
eukprot:253522-Amorphochlora_amoeboformis.AAC.1